MPKANHSVASRARRKKLLKATRGYWGSRGKVLTVAKHTYEKGLQHAYAGRKNKKRTYRQIWIVRINAAARLNGTTYSRLIDAMNKKGVTINRKVLASIAVENPQAFTDIVKFVVS